MKTKIFSLLLISFFAFSAVFAEEDENATSSQNKAVGTYIVNHIAYPDFAIENEIEAEIRVSFTINEDGQVKVLQSNCVNKELHEYFLEKLNGLVISSEIAEQSKVYYLKYTYKLN